MSSDFVTIDWQAQPVRIEYQWLDAARHDAPLMVFLHEGLGSVAMWRDYPQQLCEALQVRGLVYSRPTYGRSGAHGAPWTSRFMHDQAFEVLPALLAALGVSQAPWLFGHSDGGSIALLYASRFEVAGVIVVAPHIMVEALTVASIAQAREAYENTDLRQRLARYHEDVDAAFRGWSDIWLNPAFRNWSIEDEITTIRCPTLAIQGLDDEYGTLAQIKGITAQVPHAQCVELPHCGHSPHREQPQRLTQACVDFFHRT